MSAELAGETESRTSVEVDADDEGAMKEDDEGSCVRWQSQTTAVVNMSDRDWRGESGWPTGRTNVADGHSVGESRPTVVARIWDATEVRLGAPPRLAVAVAFVG